MCDRVAIIQNGRLLDVRSFKNVLTESETVEVRFEVNELAQALDMLTDDMTARVDDSELVVTLPNRRQAIAELNARLVKAGIGVYGIRTQIKTLEEQFLEVTRGNRIV